MSSSVSLHILFFTSWPSLYIELDFFIFREKVYREIWIENVVFMITEYHHAEH